MFLEKLVEVISISAFSIGNEIQFADDIWSGADEGYPGLL